MGHVQVSVYITQKYFLPSSTALQSIIELHDLSDTNLFNFLVVYTVFSSRERLCPKENGIFLPNGRLLEMEPLTELPSSDDLASNNGVESWLETSSKYHSCEIVDT
jgi:hypothetical protein